MFLRALGVDRALREAFGGMNTGRSVISIQDFRDIKGDLVRGRRTLPICLGEGAARAVMSALQVAWLAERRLMQPVFTPKHIATLASLMLEKVDEHEPSWTRSAGAGSHGRPPRSCARASWRDGRGSQGYIVVTVARRNV